MKEELQFYIMNSGLGWNYFSLFCIKLIFVNNSILIYFETYRDC